MDMTGAVWRKSRQSNNGGNCVEVAKLRKTIGVRDSKDPDAGHLSLTPAAWAAFTLAIRGGHHDLWDSRPAGQVLS
ncbi:DUF397 domain-containing protein [Actinomadura sp. NPDC047616]|uniref:DUF397 domain-containing protein n=1 Tax=Actinomadura sp. NPDC047616 TaxID=3155914 RepID=UPI0033EE7C85